MLTVKLFTVGKIYINIPHAGSEVKGTVSNGCAGRLKADFNKNTFQVTLMFNCTYKVIIIILRSAKKT